jgi:hypothetical protein
MKKISISAGFTITEPIRLGYHTYKECAESLLSFCDEVIAIIGRDEQESTKLLKKLGVKTIITNEWPEDYHYDDMKKHFQMIFDNSSGDICFKIDVDHVFRVNQGQNIRNEIIELQDCHRINFSGIKFVKYPNYFKSTKNKGLYGINRKLLKKDKISFKIDNSSGSNQPVFSSEIKEKSIKEEHLKPINYDCSFMTKKQIIYKWRSWFTAYNRKMKPKQVNKYLKETDANILSGFISYHKNKNEGAIPKNNFHPNSMTEKIKKINKNMWSYNNFE